MVRDKMVVKQAVFHELPVAPWHGYNFRSSWSAAQNGWYYLTYHRQLWNELIAARKEKLDTAEREKQLSQWEDGRNREQQTRREEAQRQMKREERQRELLSYRAQQEQKRLQHQQLMDWHSQLKIQMAASSPLKKSASLLLNNGSTKSHRDSSGSFLSLPPITWYIHICMYLWLICVLIYILNFKKIKF